MRLRAHATVATAITALDDALNRLANATNTGSDETMRDSFLRTHDELETTLANTFDRVDVIALLQTARYWHLMQTYLGPAERHLLHIARPVNMAVSQECDALKTALTAHREAFADLSKWLAQPGLLVLADTNVMIHCLPIDQIDWRTALKDHTRDPAPRILVPLPVIDEIDRKKFEAGGNTARRAKAAIASLRTLREGVRAGQPAQVKAANGSTVSLEIPRHDVGRAPLPRVDDELIDYGQFLARTGSRPVVVVTRDYGIETRATWSDLHFVWLDEKYQKDQE